MCVFHNKSCFYCRKMLLQSVTGAKLRENTISDFYCNLTITDLCVGLIVQPLKVICCLSAVIEQGNLCRYILKTSVIMAYILGGVSLTITPAIGVDRLLALLLQLRYKEIVTLKKTFIVVSVICNWVWTIVSTLKTTNYDSKPLAETVWGGAISIS